MNIGFVGLGRMGMGMARNLMKAGHQLTVFNRTREKVEPLRGDGARVAHSSAEAARHADAVFTMLADDLALEEMVLGEDGIAAGLAPAAAHISSSTISTRCARRLAEEHRKRKQVMISAPVFGRPDAAEAKKLLVVAAGDEDQLDRFRSLFDQIGRLAFIAGPEPWQANALKLCGNFMIASMLETFGEAFAVLRKSRIEPQVFLEVMKELFGSPVYAAYGAAIANSKFEPPGFALKLGLKDVREALRLGEEAGAPMPFASIMRDHFISALANGQENLDWSSIALVSARAAGLQAG